jgi:tetrahydromethanopterin S-methyltransferase subunit B
MISRITLKQYTMKVTGQRMIARLVMLLVMTALTASVRAQAGTSAVLDTADLKSQMEYLKERTRVYDEYRAIRDDIFLKMQNNALDSLNSQKSEVARLNSEVKERDTRIEALNSDLNRAKSERDQAIRTKDGFSFLGIQLQKAIYNTIMWVIVIGLAVLVVILFLMFKRSHVVTSHTRKELESVQQEFEDYRKSSREKYEKLVVSHHNEIMKLKRN